MQKKLNKVGKVEKVGCQESLNQKKKRYVECLLHLIIMFCKVIFLETSLNLTVG